MYVTKGSVHQGGVFWRRAAGTFTFIAYAEMRLFGGVREGFCGAVDKYCIMKTGNAGKLQGDPIQRQLEWVWLFREVRFIHMNCVDSDCYEAWNRGDGLNHVLEEKWRKNAA